MRRSVEQQAEHLNHQIRRDLFTHARAETRSRRDNLHAVNVTAGSKLDAERGHYELFRHLTERLNARIPDFQRFM
ncbi:hypothetical protein C8R44DRAFT_761490 [Mycena epipterygia]|nr:hypothetical protein C8R44DRAFT_761490 [Mycena epipterygia]